MPNDWKDSVKKFFKGDRKVVPAKAVLDNKVILKNPFGPSAGSAIHQRIAEAELAAQSKAAAAKAKK